MPRTIIHRRSGPPAIWWYLGLHSIILGTIGMFGWKFSNFTTATVAALAAATTAAAAAMFSSRPRIFTRITVCAIFSAALGGAFFLSAFNQDAVFGYWGNLTAGTLHILLVTLVTHLMIRRFPLRWRTPMWGRLEATVFQPDGIYQYSVGPDDGAIIYAGRIPAPNSVPHGADQPNSPPATGGTS